MNTPKKLSTIQYRGLLRVGDVIVPGDGEFPSFTRSGVAAHADRMLDYMTDSDLAGVRFLFTLFTFLPKPLIRGLLWLTDRDRSLPGPLGAACRMIRIGVKGVVTTLYYSDFGDQSPSILDRIHWDAKIVERDACSQSPA